MILSHYLESWGASIHLAKSGAEAIEKLRESISKSTPFKFVLMDDNVGD